jgi:hypothetical protein
MYKWQELGAVYTLHVYESVYDYASVSPFQQQKKKNHLLDGFGSKSYTESYADSYTKSHV